MGDKELDSVSLNDSFKQLNYEREERNGSDMICQVRNKKYVMLYHGSGNGIL